MDYKIKNGILVKCKVAKGKVMLPKGIVSSDDENCPKSTMYSFFSQNGTRV